MVLLFLAVAAVAQAPTPKAAALINMPGRLRSNGRPNDAPTEACDACYRVHRDVPQK